MKGTILDAHVEGDTSYVTKQTKYGTFTGKVVLQPEDQDIRSQVLGFNFAEIKCDIQALKIKAKVFKDKMLGIQHAYNVLLKAGQHPENPTMKALYRQLQVAIKNYEDNYEIYTLNRDSYLERVERMLEYRRKIKNK